jgi:hypothetical protein
MLLSVFLLVQFLAWRFSEISSDIRLKEQPTSPDQKNKRFEKYYPHNSLESHINPCTHSSDLRIFQEPALNELRQIKHNQFSPLPSLSGFQKNVKKCDPKKITSRTGFIG